jgi:acetyltransferase-like isoleucine patch superfamily enzyme
LVATERINSRIRYGLERRFNVLMGRIRVFWGRFSGARIGIICSFGKRVSFVYGWRTSIGAKCVIDDFVQFKTPTCNSQNKRFNICLNDNVFIGRGTIIDSNLSVIIGRNVLIAPYCFITDTEHEFDDKTKPIFAQGWKYKPVIIEDDVWIGTHTVIIAGIHIGHGSIIGAHSTVTHDIPPNSVACGSPARIIKTRDQR